MAATVVVVEQNGTSGSPTETVDPSNLNMGSAAQAELDPSSNPVIAGADAHSYEKWLKLRVTAMGGSSSVDNFKAWLSSLGGGYKTEEGMSANLRAAGYIQASYPSGGPVDSDSGVADQKMPEEEPNGANVGIGGSLSGQVTSAPGDTDWVVLQLDVGENTPTGPLNQKTITFQWDEQ